MRALLAVLLALAGAGAAAGESPWEKEVRRFEQEDAARPPKPGGVVFTGSSTTRLWDLKASFPEIQPVNRGFGGSTYAGLAELAPRIFAAWQPETVVVYSGDNDIAHGETPQAVLEAFKKFAEWFHNRFPEARLIVLSAKPSIARWEMRDKMAEMNGLIEGWLKGKPWGTWVDMWPVTLGPDGAPRKDLFMEDGLHLSAEGYKAWTERVEGLLTGKEAGEKAQSSR